MPFGLRLIPFFAALALLIGMTASAAAQPNKAPVPQTATTAPVVRPGADSATKSTAIDSTAVDSTAVGSTAVDSTAADSSADDYRAVLQPASGKKDTLRPPPPVFGWESPWGGIRECPAGREEASECWRREKDLANQGIGFPGARAWSLSLTHYRPLPLRSPYFAFWSSSPYLSGGLAPPERYAIDRQGSDAIALEEIWTPVVPLDTPFTRLDWERGALSLNLFHLSLDRMLSDRVYLGLDFHSATGDSQDYDYQFNVHQPYLGGWAFLGQIYSPIQRDSASLVLEGVSHTLGAQGMRPRVGVWLDTGRVVEFFLDRTRNSSSLTFPYGPSRPVGSLVPTGPDSAQGLMPSEMSAFGQGLIYGETHRDWTSQFELSHGSLDVMEFRTADSAARGRDELRAQQYRLRAKALAGGLMARPSLSLEARSEDWEGPLAGNGPPRDRGWMDAQDAELAVNPNLGFLNARASAGIGRSSRMDNQVFWLERYGGSAGLDLPFGFGAVGAFSSRAEDPSWETLYRSNPARFRHASPGLGPRTDRTYRAGASWAFSRYSLEAGMDWFRSEDAWLPRVLPGPGACAYAADSAYADLPGLACAGGGGDSAGTLPDSVALAMRNYASESVDAWYLGLGFGLGNWSLDIRNKFVFARSVEDPGLRAVLEDLSIPERVFKGRLGWKRSLVNDKLKVDLGWEWEWFSTRYAWVPDLAGNSRVVKLDEYLALDFEAAMRIKTFTLFFKTRNFNHDRYATEPGVHPPGVNFRFGVDWVLKN